MKFLNEININGDKVATSEEINNIHKEINNEIILSKSTLGYQQKNLIKNITYTTRTVDGVTFNVNSDNTITINGTSTSRYCDFYIYGWYKSTNTVLSKTGDYTISMGDSFVDSGIVAYIITNGTWAVKEFTTSSTNYTITDNTSTHITCFMIRVPEGVTVNNVTVYPIIRYSFIDDDTYEPYVDDINTRLNDNVNDIAINKTTLGYQKKNLLNNVNVTKTTGGVTFTVNADKSVSLSGTSTGQIFLYFDFDEQLINNQKVILSGCPSGGNSNTYALAIRYYNENGAERYVFDTGSEITVTPADVVQIILVIRAGVNTDGLTFYPMLRYAEVIDDTYEPYIDDIDTRIIENKSDIKINETTLGYTKKNLFKPIYKEGYSGGWGGKLFTFNSDGSITVSGTATAEMAFGLSIIYLDVGNYIISSNPGFNLQLYLDGSYISGAWVSPEGVEISITTAGNYEFKWWHGSGTSVSTTIYPMLRYADITDDTYEPYIDSVDKRLNNIENNLKDDILLYSGSPATPNVTITINGLFTNYSVISIIAIVDNDADTYRSATISLSSLKSQSISADDFNIKYVDDNNINIFSGMYSGAPNYKSIKIYAIR